MFGILKKKLSKLVESITKKTESKEVQKPTEQVEENKEIVEEAPIEIQKLEEKVDEIIEEAKEIQEDRIPKASEQEILEEKKEKPAVENEIEKKVDEIILESEKETIKPKEEIKIDVVPKIEEAKSEVVVEEPKEKKSFFKKIIEKVSKTVTERKLSEEDLTPLLQNFQNDLIESDVAVEVTDKIISDLKSNLVDREVKRGKVNEAVLSSLKNSLLEILNVEKMDFLNVEKKPFVIVFLGFNGSGKTTSLAKMAHWLIENGKTCVFAAGDTFRAAAEEQLEIHAKNLNVNLIKHKHGADPAAVIFDSIEHAKAKGIDYVLADTAGRAHTNRNLMDQMQKIVRVNKPDLKVLVIDSLTGNDAVMQARMYNEIGVDAVIFTKVDVNEKGGAILSVTHELKKPILFLGYGQEYKNFERFDAEKFVNNLLQ